MRKCVIYFQGRNFGQVGLVKSFLYWLCDVWSCLCLLRGLRRGWGEVGVYEDGVTPADLVSGNVRAHSPSLATAQKGLSSLLGPASCGHAWL